MLQPSYDEASQFTFPSHNTLGSFPCMTTGISHKRCARSIICIWGEVWDLFITLVLYQSIRKIHILIENIQRENQRLIKFPATQMYKR